MFISYRSDLYEAGRTEDGDVVHGQAFYVYCELEDGSRFAHQVSFNDTVSVPCDDDCVDAGGPPYFFEVSTEECKAKAAALAEKVQAAGIMNPAHWNRLDPAYGSAAYGIGNY